MPVCHKNFAYEHVAALNMKMNLFTRLLFYISDQSHTYTKTTEKEQKDLYISECRNEQENLKQQFSEFNRIFHLSLGQMTVYRVKIECMCDVKKADERCAKFLPQDKQSWSMYLGKLGDGVFRTRN